MGQTDANSNNRDTEYWHSNRQKDLKLTVIFAPVSRSELLDLYNPIEYPVVDREMRVLNRKIADSGSYTPETQDKVVYINCASLEVAVCEEGPVPLGASAMDKVKRAIQLIHELLDYWYGYKGTVYTTFCCYKPLEGLMESLQTILKCPPSYSSIYGPFISEASGQFGDAFDSYPEWTFVSVFSGVYEAEYEYIVRNEKSDIEVLQERNQQLVDGLSEKEKALFRQNEWGKTDEIIYGDHDYVIIERKQRAMDAFKEYYNNSPEDSKFRKAINEIEKNNKKISKIQKKEQKHQEWWNNLSRAQKLGYTKKKIGEAYDKKIEASDVKNAPFIQELEEKRLQLGYQMSGESQFHPKDAERAYEAYDLGVDLHGETHRRDQIEYNGEYYTMDQLNKMYYALKSQRTKLEREKEQAIKNAWDDIIKQDRLEGIEFVVSIFNLVSIVIAPLALVDIIVIAAKMCSEDYKKNVGDAVSIALDIFALLPFFSPIKYFKLFKLEKVGETSTKIGKTATGFGKTATDIVVNDITKQGKNVVTSATKSESEIAEGLVKNADNLGLDVTDITKAAAEEKAERQLEAELSAKANQMSAKGDQMLETAKQLGKVSTMEESDAFLKAASDFGKKADDLITEGVEHGMKADTAELAKERLMYTMMDDHLFEVNQLLAGNVPNIGGGAGELLKTLPVVTLGEYSKEISLYLKNLTNMSKEGRSAAVKNLMNQGAQHAASAYGVGSNVYSLATNGESDDPTKPYTMASNDDNFILVVKN